MHLNKLKDILYSLNIGNEGFWHFLTNKVKVLPLGAQDFPWACFPIVDENGILIDIRLLVPAIKDEETLLVNIHEYTHAFELYGKLHMSYEEDVPKSEALARSKEQEYLSRKK